MWYWLAGLIATAALGSLLVPPFLRWLRRQMEPRELLADTSESVRAAWTKLTVHPDPSGNWVGFFERLVLFWALGVCSWEAVGIWIAFKVAAKWEARNHLAYVPDKIEGAPSELDWPALRRVWAAREYATFVVGTACNLFLAAGGVWIGRHGEGAIGMLCASAGR